MKIRGNINYNVTQTEQWGDGIHVAWNENDQLTIFHEMRDTVGVLTISNELSHLNALTYNSWKVGTQDFHYLFKRSTFNKCIGILSREQDPLAAFNTVCDQLVKDGHHDETASLASYCVYKTMILEARKLHVTQSTSFGYYKLLKEGKSFVNTNRSFCRLLFSCSFSEICRRMCGIKGMLKKPHESATL